MTDIYLTGLSKLEGQWLLNMFQKALLALQNNIHGWTVLKVANSKQRPKENANALSLS